jgi:plasmid maintenance system antidote protein VapI
MRGITVDTALRLSVFFGTDAQSWTNLQTHYDTELARVAMAGVLTGIVRRELVETANRQMRQRTQKGEAPQSHRPAPVKGESGHRYSRCS